MDNKRFDILIARPKRGEGTWWHRIGSAIENEKGIVGFLDSLPFPDKEGRVSFILREPKPKQDQAQQSAPAKPVAEDISDEIPF